MSKLKITTATEHDAPVILDLIRQLAEYERLSHEVIATEQQIRDTLFGEHPAAEVLLASFEGETVGYAVFFTNYSTFFAKSGFYLEDLFVKPHVRGKGVGKALMARLAQLALERNCGRINWQVLNWNEPSLAFYRSLGATPLDEWTTYQVAGEALDRLAAQSK